jgi:hypothetical protein
MPIYGNPVIGARKSVAESPTSPNTVVHETQIANRGALALAVRELTSISKHCKLTGFGTTQR